MSTTGVQSFNPPLGDFSFYALSRCGVKRTEVAADHLADVAMAANLTLADLATEQANLWNVTLISTPLVQGTTQYTMPNNVLLVLNCYLRTTISMITRDRVIYGVSREEYASYPNKAQQAAPTVYWADRTAPTVLNIYPTPDDGGPYTLFVYAIQQDDDAAIGGAATLDIPYQFLKAFSDGLCKELALTYAPERVEGLTLEYEASKKRAQAQNREIVPFQITPSLGRYYRANG